MSAKHTPGPWSFIASPNCWSVLQVGSSGRWVIAGGTAWAIPGRQSEAEANARLIAAAPDLLEWLRWALSAMAARNPAWTEGDNFIAASAAIAKATGEAT